MTSNSYVLSILQKGHWTTYFFPVLIHDFFVYHMYCSDDITYRILGDGEILTKLCMQIMLFGKVELYITLRASVDPAWLIMYNIKLCTHASLYVYIHFKRHNFRDYIFKPRPVTKKKKVSLKKNLRIYRCTAPTVVRNTYYLVICRKRVKSNFAHDMRVSGAVWRRNGIIYYNNLDNNHYYANFFFSFFADGRRESDMWRADSWTATTRDRHRRPSGTTAAAQCYFFISSAKP